MAKKVLARAYKGRLVVESEKAGKYYYKLLTLTCPGKEYREKYTPTEVLHKMTKDWHKLITALKKRGRIDYLRVVEAQKDGYPHFHVLIFGRAIAPRDTLGVITKLWAKYGGGFVRFLFYPVKGYSMRFWKRALMHMPLIGVLS